MPAGRPTSFNQRYVEKAKEYLASCIDEETERIKTSGEKSTTYQLGLKVNLPSVAGLAIYLGVWRSTIYEWKETYPEFSDILEEILAEQEKRLIEGGIGGTYNPLIAKLVLGKHGYSDKQEVTGKDGKDLVPENPQRQLAENAIAYFLKSNDNTRNTTGK